MTLNKSFTIIVRSPGRQQEEYWETIEPQEAAFWKEAAFKLANYTYQHEGCEVDVAIDWAPLVRRLLRDHDLLTPIRLRQQPPTLDWHAKLSQPLRLTAACSIKGRNKLSENFWYSEFFIEYFLYEVFTIVNLACPGAAEFLNFELRRDKRIPEERMGLSAFYFGEWMISTKEGKAPQAKVLDLETTIDWFRTVNPHVTQKAENNTQRALYAMYQLSKSDGHIDFIMWLFNALESLLGTRVGENFSGLVRRSALLLQLNDKEKKELSKKLRELYDLRSSFVHGGYQVAHPLHREPIDPRLDEDYSRILNLSIYGFGVLGALLQSMIEQRLPFVVFEERIVLPEPALNEL
jgi:hypothetical protein